MLLLSSAAIRSRLSWAYLGSKQGELAGTQSLQRTVTQLGGDSVARELRVPRVLLDDQGAAAEAEGGYGCRGAAGELAAWVVLETRTGRHVE